MQQVPLKNVNFKIVKKIEQIKEKKHRKFSQNFGFPAPLGAIKG